MPDSRTICRNRRCYRAALGNAAAALCALLAINAAWADGLRVENADEVRFAVGEMTTAAAEMGLSRQVLAQTLTRHLGSAGLSARHAAGDDAESILFVDVVVDGEAYYVSLGFWRKASYPQPGGGQDTDFVTVWQDYAVGAHHGESQTVYETTVTIIDRFIARYSEANRLDRDVTVAAAP